MLKIGMVGLLGVVFTQVCISQPLPPVDSSTVDLFVDYYLKNMVYYFYPLAGVVESELKKVQQLLNESSISRDSSKAKALQFIRANINQVLSDLQRRNWGCAIHLHVVASLRTIRDLVVDTGDRELLAQYNRHADVIDEAIDWQYYDSNRAKVMHEIRLACLAYGFEREYNRKLTAKLC